MTTQHKSLHKLFLKYRERFRKFELEFIKLIQDCEATRLHRAMGCPSVFQYAVDVLAFSESVAYVYISVARKSLEIPQLLRSGLSVSKASRIVSALTPENADELIAFALSNTNKKIDREVARRNPKAGREKIKCLSDEFFSLEFKADSNFPELLSHVQSLQAQRGLDAGVGSAVMAGLKEYIRRFDPVEKAKRMALRKQKVGNGKCGQKKKAGQAESAEYPSFATDLKNEELCLNRVTSKRKPLTAEQRHAVNLRDGGRCVHQDAEGKQCLSDRWVEIHHVREVSRGGSNEPENLVTLCSFHHAMFHQAMGHHRNGSSRNGPGPQEQHPRAASAGAQIIRARPSLIR